MTKQDRDHWASVIIISILALGGFLFFGNIFALADSNTSVAVTETPLILPLPTEKSMVPTVTATPTYAPSVDNSTDTSAQNSVMSGSVIPLPSSYASNQTVLPYYPETLHIENGQCVPLNSTVDISSLGWGVPEISWMGPYYTGFVPDNVTDKYDLPLSNRPSLLKNFYIDPAIFGNKMGYWYQNYGQQSYVLASGYNYVPDGSANNRMFYVNLTCPAPTKQNFTVTITQINTTIPKLQSFLPLKKESDILLAIGDTISLAESGPIHWWLFGYGAEQQILDQPAPNGVATLDTSTWNLEPGDYIMDKVQPGYTGIFEVRYDPGYYSGLQVDGSVPAIWRASTNPYKPVAEQSISGLNPQNVRELLEQDVKTSVSNNISSWYVSLQNAEITVDRIDATSNPSNETYLNLRGYTNVKNDTPISITVDNGQFFYKQNKTWNTVAIAVDADPGIWREYNTLIPIDYGKMFPGQHYITVSTSYGASMTVPFYIYQAPPDSYVPPQYIRYIGSSPFIPPVTVTVTVPVPGPTRIVTVRETPSNEQIDSAAWALVDEVLEYIGAMIAICFGALLFARYLYRVYRRRKWMSP